MSPVTMKHQTPQPFTRSYALSVSLIGSVAAHFRMANIFCLLLGIPSIQFILTVSSFYTVELLMNGEKRKYRIDTKQLYRLSCPSLHPPEVDYENLIANCMQSAASVPERQLFINLTSCKRTSSLHDKTVLCVMPCDSLEWNVELFSILFSCVTFSSLHLGKPDNSSKMDKVQSPSSA